MNGAPLDNLPSRLLYIAAQLFPAYRRFKALEEKTGISSDRWKAFFLGRQRPTVEMIEGFGNAFPEYSEWLLTGQTRFLLQVKPSGVLDDKTPTAEQLVEILNNMQLMLQRFSVREPG